MTFVAAATVIRQGPGERTIGVMTTTTSPAAGPTGSTGGRVRPALAGLAAVAAALAAAEPVLGLRRGAVSPVVAVGGWVIDHVPAPVKQFAIRTFGTNDKVALQVGIVAILAVVAVGLGYASRRKRVLGDVGAATFGAIGLAAALGRPGAGVVDAALPSAVGALAAAAVLRLLLPHVPREAAGPSLAVDAPDAALGRRGFLVRGGAVVVGGAAAGGIGRAMQRRFRVASTRAAIVLPPAARPAPPRPDGMDLGVPGVEPFMTPNADFYRIDTALVLPQVDPGDWRLRIHGMVERELTFTYDDLLRRPLVARDLTLVCVSNEVGGHYAGTARWLGVPLADLLREAGVRPGADQLVSRSVDGYTAGTPVAAVLDGRDALVAIGMNDEPLPIAHGFPARLVIPGLYGYVSATKWLRDIELTTFDAYDAYWVQRGWAPQAAVKTMARIDTPRGLASLPAGRVPVAGVSWAPHRGITGVEVRVDDGPWQPARIGSGPTADTWRQWIFDWDATPGRHQLTARATDGTGAVQTDERRPPMPDGASGWHSVVVLVA